MLLPPSGDQGRGKCWRTAVRRSRRLSSRVGSHMDPEYSESIEFNCQFFAITARKEGIEQKDERGENRFVFSHPGSPPLEFFRKYLLC